MPTKTNSAIFTTGSYKCMWVSGSYALTGSYVSSPTGGVTASPSTFNNINTSEQTFSVSKLIKIPWRIYKLSDIPNDLARSKTNAHIIGESIQRWWSEAPSWKEGMGMSFTELSNVYITDFHLVIDKIPLEQNGKIIEKIGIMPVAVFNSPNAALIEDNDFVFGGTINISKTNPNELVSMIISGIEIIPGKYEMKI